MSIFESTKIAIWDLDGTIIDSYGVFATVVAEAAILSGREAPDSETIRHNYHGTLDSTIKAIFDMVDDPSAAELLLNDFLRIQEQYYQNPDEHVFPDALRLAKRLDAAGVRQVIATNRAHEGRGSASPRYLINNSRMKTFIKDFVCGDDAPIRKPDPGILDYFEQSLSDIHPYEIVVLGDQFVDAQLAQNIGCKAILASRNPEPIPHIEKLGANIAFMQIVSSFDEV